MTNKKQAVAAASVFASAAMTAMKLAVGLMTGSLGILSEAAHSLLDMGAATLTWFAVRIGDRPADAEHPWGHAKVENVSALIETGLLFLTSAWIIKEAVERLRGEAATVEVTWYAVAVIVVSMLIDFGRARALTKVARETGSAALEADALHFSSDIASSAVVLVGLGLTAWGWPQGDAVAAIGVAGFVCLAGWRLGRRTIDMLIDTAPRGIAEEVTQIAAAVPGIARVDRVRARPAGATIYVELVVRVGRGRSFGQVQALRDAVATAICAARPEIDPLVVAEPLTLDDEDVAEAVRVVAANRGVAVHDIAFYTLGATRHVGFDLEVDDGLTVREAHDVASEIETALATELGADIGIDIHIDPRRNRIDPGETVEPGELTRLTRLVEEVVAQHPPGSHVHRLFAQRGPDGLYLSFHCRFPPEASIRLAHALTERMEAELRWKLGDVARVVVHAEPQFAPGGGAPA